MSEIMEERRDGVGILTLNRPEKYNALAGTMRQVLLDRIEAAGADPEVRVLILTGAGKAFCAGGDVWAMRETQVAEDRETFAGWLDLGGKIVLALRRLSKPVLAAVNGPAAGAGCNLALACDVRYAAESATFGQAFVKLGLHPDWGGSRLLPRLIGTARAAEMMFTGNPVDARTALEFGLVNAVFPDGDLMTQVLARAMEMTRFSARSLAEIKKSLYLDSDLDATVARERDVQLDLWASDDARRRVEAFTAGRPKR